MASRDYKKRVVKNAIRKGWDDPDERTPPDYSDIEFDADDLRLGIKRLWSTYEDATDMNRRGKELSNTLYYRNDRADSTYRGTLDRKVMEFLEYNMPESVDKYKYKVESFRGDAISIVEEASSKFDMLMGKYSALLQEIEAEANDKIRDLEGTIGY